MKLVLPSSLPLIFTGMRLSLGVGWMVLIAAEMLAQNPGLGKFVWDEFQNGSAESMSRMLVAVFTIGFIGFLLDRVMLTLQSLTDFSGEALVHANPRTEAGQQELCAGRAALVGAARRRAWRSRRASSWRWSGFPAAARPR